MFSITRLIKCNSIKVKFNGDFINQWRKLKLLKVIWRKIKSDNEENSEKNKSWKKKAEEENRTKL